MPGTLAGSTALLTLTRVLNIVLGVLLIPLLLHFLGGDGFASWAILLSWASILGQLEAGVPIALVKHMAVPAARGDKAEVGRLLSTAMGFGLAVYVAVLPMLVAVAPSLARWLNLTGGDVLSPSGLLVLTFVAAALRSLLQYGIHALFAARDFRLVAALSFFQAFLSNLAATAGAAVSRRLDVALAAFWALQLLVTAAAFLVARHRLSWRFRWGSADFALFRRFVAHGLGVQAYDWTHALGAQIAKLVVAVSVGLFDVARYEAALRGTLALRSIPTSGTSVFLPAAALMARDEARLPERYRAMAVLAGDGALLFLAAPAAIAPVFLFAWVGEMGYVSRWAFSALVLGAAAGLLTAPAAAVAQALDRPGLLARAAAVALSCNLAVSLLLVPLWGAEGAATATGLATVLGAALLLRDVHRLCGLRPWEPLRHVASRLWPMAAACAAWGVAAHWGFAAWFHSTAISVRYGIGFRAGAGVVSLALYAGCVLAMIGARARWGTLEEEEQSLLAPYLVRFR